MRPIIEITRDPVKDGKKVTTEFWYNLIVNSHHIYRFNNAATADLIRHNLEKAFADQPSQSFKDMVQQSTIALDKADKTEDVEAAHRLELISASWSIAAQICRLTDLNIADRIAADLHGKGPLLKI